MEKKKFSIELPKGGMSDLTKQVRNSPITEPPADATEWQRFTRGRVQKRLRTWRMCLAV